VLAGTPAIALPCVGCEFAFKLDYSAPTAIREDGNAYCTAYYSSSSVLTDAPPWEAYGLGYHTDYAGWGPTLMLYYPPYAIYPARWEAQASGMATYSAGTFTFDWPVSYYTYY